MTNDKCMQIISFCYTDTEWLNTMSSFLDFVKIGPFSINDLNS